MLETDEDALICDLAETYNIYDYRSLPLRKVATFSVGLRADSRIKMRMNNMQHPLEILLLAAAVDRLSILVWSKTEDAQHGYNRPKSIFEKLTEEEQKDVMSFDTPDQFEKEWKKILERSER